MNQDNTVANIGIHSQSDQCMAYKFVAKPFDFDKPVSLNYRAAQTMMLRRLGLAFAPFKFVPPES